MPLYFFNIHDQRCEPDPYGTELADLGSARFEAVILAGYILRDHAADVLQCDNWHLSVTDENNEAVFCLGLSLTADRPI